MKSALKKQNPKAPGKTACEAPPFRGAGISRNESSDVHGEGERRIAVQWEAESFIPIPIKIQFSNQFLRMVRPGSCETRRPDAGGEGIGCPARVSKGILPAPSRRHTSKCVSEDGILAVRPRGRVPTGFGIRHAAAGARTPSRL